MTEIAWNPHDELDGTGCPYGWRNRQYIRNIFIVLSFAGLCLTVILYLAASTNAQARESARATARLTAAGAAQQATLDALDRRLERLNDNLDRIMGGGER